MVMYSNGPCVRLRLSFFLQRVPLWKRAYASSSYSVPPTPGASEAEVLAARAYCSRLLQNFDSPSYTLQTFIPPPAQAAYLAIRAFNLELAKVADTVSTPAIGAMRLQFWRDNISKAFAGSPPAHPVSVLLAHALDDLDVRTGGKARLSKNWFMRIISAREQYLNNAPYTSLNALEKYAESTYSTLLYLTLSALPMTSITVDHLASHIGKAVGITAVLRGLPLIAFPPPPNHHSNSRGLGGILDSQRRHQGAVTLPLDVMAETGVREEDVLRQGADAPGLRDAVFTVATRASDHLITARQMLKNLRAGKDVGHEFEHEGEEGHDYSSGPSGMGGPHSAQTEETEKAFGVLMPAVSTSLWLDRLQQLDFDIFREELRRREWKLAWKAYLAYRRRLF